MLDQEYTPADIEQKWYGFWLTKKFFHAPSDNKKTGLLHSHPASQYNRRPSYGTRPQYYSSGHTLPFINAWTATTPSGCPGPTMQESQLRLSLKGTWPKKGLPVHELGRDGLYRRGLEMEGKARQPDHKPAQTPGGVMRTGTE